MIRAIEEAGNSEREITVISKSKYLSDALNREWPIGKPAVGRGLPEHPGRKWDHRALEGGHREGHEPGRETPENTRP